MNPEKKLRLRLSAFGIITTMLFVIADQFTKNLAVRYLRDQQPFQIIKGVFELQYLENRGAAFGILQEKKNFLIISTILVVMILLWMYWKLPIIKRYHFVRCILILFVSGAIGNFIDRCVHDYVIDFFYFKLIDFPVFNMADIYITLAAVTLLITFFFYYKEEDIDIIIPDIFHKKKCCDRG